MILKRFRPQELSEVKKKALPQSIIICMSLPRQRLQFAVPAEGLIGAPPQIHPSIPTFPFCRSANSTRWDKLSAKFTSRSHKRICYYPHDSTSLLK